MECCKVYPRRKSQAKEDRYTINYISEAALTVKIVKMCDHIIAV